MTSRQRLVLTLTVLAMVAVTGCKKRTGSRTTSSHSSSTEAATPSSDSDEAAPGEKPVIPTDEPVDPRVQAMDDAYRAMVRGDDTALTRLQALGADQSAVVDRALASKNVNAVLKVAELAEATPKDAELDGPVLSLLDHTAPVVRVAALDAISARRSGAALEPTLALLRDAELDVRASACDTLASIRNRARGTLQAVLALASDDEDAVRAACAGAFADLAKRDEWQDQLIALLNSKKITSREGALRILSNWRDPISFDLIRGRLSDEEGVVVAAALASLAPFGDEPTFREVARFLVDERLAVRVEAVAAMEKLPKELTRNLVFEALKDRVPMVRIEAATQLARYTGDAEAQIRLHALLRDEDMGVRDAAAVAALERADAGSFDALAERLGEEKEEHVATTLVEAMAASDMKRAIPHLIDRLEDKRGRVRTAVILALRTKTGQDLPLDPKPWKAWYAKAGAAGAP